MRHPFRTWLEAQDIDEASRALFEEGLTCYSVGAYSAALVFSYLGLLRSLAHRLMFSWRPIDIPEKLWAQIQRTVREDLTWEETAYESLVRQKPASLFLVGDDLRHQLEYWRNRRNDAAHARTNEISAPHVESLWLFVQSNHPKFIVAGGRPGLYERFRRHLDPSYTAPGQDFSNLVAEMPAAIRPQEYGDFIRDILKLTDDIPTEDEPFDDFPELSKEGGFFLQQTFSLNDKLLNQAIVDVLRTDSQLLLASVLASPRLTLLISNDASFVRKLWHDLLPFETVLPFYPDRPFSACRGLHAS